MNNENKSGLEILAHLHEGTEYAMRLKECSWSIEYLDVGKAAFKSKDVKTLWFTSFDSYYLGFDGFEAPGGDRMVEAICRLWNGQPTHSDATTEKPGRHLIAQNKKIYTEKHRSQFKDGWDKSALSQIMDVPYNAAPCHNIGENPRIYRLK